MAKQKEPEDLRWVARTRQEKEIAELHYDQQSGHAISDLAHYARPVVQQVLEALRLRVAYPPLYEGARVRVKALVPHEGIVLHEMAPTEKTTYNLRTEQKLHEHWWVKSSWGTTAWHSRATLELLDD